MSDEPKKSDGQHPEAPKPEAPKAEPKKLTEENIRLYAALSYVGPLFIVPRLLAKDNDFAMFHARQGLGLFVLEVLASFVAYVPFLGWALSILLLVISVYGLFKALQGVRWEMPVLGPAVKDIKF